MSQSIQDYTSFAIQFPPEKGMNRQNARLAPTWGLSLLLVCSLLLASPAVSYAQPSNYDEWVGFNRLNDNNLDGRSMWTSGIGFENVVHLENNGGVYGATTGNWWVAGNLIHEGVGMNGEGIRHLTSLTVEGDMDNWGRVHDVSYIRVEGNLANQGEIRDVHSIEVGSFRTDDFPIPDFPFPGFPWGDDVSDFTNAGTLANIRYIDVTGNIYFREGTNLEDVRAITAGRDIVIDCEINGGFRTLDAEGTLNVSVNGDLTIAGGLTPSRVLGGAVENAGNITNRGVLHSDTTFTNAGGSILNTGAITSLRSFSNYGTIVNHGTIASGAWNATTKFTNTGNIANHGVISSFGNFENSGKISGGGTVSIIGNGHFRNMTGGMIDGGLIVNGNFSSEAGSSIYFQRGEVITVNGEATISGGTVITTGLPDGTDNRGQQYLFLQSTSPDGFVIGNFNNYKPLTVEGKNEPGSVFGYAPVYGNWNGTRYVVGQPWGHNQHYWLEMQRVYSYGEYARTPNQRAVAEYLDTVGYAVKEFTDNTKTQNSAFWNLLQQLDAISERHPDYDKHHSKVNPAALVALDELSGMIYANLGAAAVHNTGTVNRTLADVLRSDVFKFSNIGNPNNAIRGQAIAPLRYTRWGTVFGIGGNSSHDGNADGYKTSFGGVLAGVDRAMWTGTRVGGYLSAAVGDVSMRNLSESSDVTSVSVGMYLRQEMYYGYGLVSAGFGTDWYKTERNLTMIGHTAESKTHAKIGTFYMERGIDIPVYYATVQPYTSFQVVSVHQDTFTETMRDQTGRYTNIGLEGVEGKTNSFKLALGARAASQPIPMRWGQLALTGNMAWFHDFQGKNDRDFIARLSNPGGSNYGASFSNTTFRIYGNDPKQDWFNFGLGLNMDRNSTRVFLSGDLFTNNRQTLFSGGGGVVTSW